MRLRIVVALTAHGASQRISLGDLSLLLADQDFPPPAPAATLLGQVKFLAKIAVVGFEEDRHAPKAVCWLLDSYVLDDVIALSERACKEISGLDQPRSV